MTPAAGTQAAHACTEPGCTGHYVDGWCDVCGSPERPSGTTTSAAQAAGASVAGPAFATAAATASGTALPTMPDGSRCLQPGCTGHYLDGYCDVCGASADSPPATSPAAASSAPAPSGPAYPDTQATQPATQPGRPGPGIPPGTSTGAPGPGAAGGPSTGAAASGARASGPGRESPVAATASVATASRRLGSTALGSERARSSGSRATKRLSTSSTRLRSHRLGQGLTTIPPVPAIDAEKALMRDPVVPEDKRFCAKCGTPVGRGLEGRPGRTQGFCPKCRQAYSFDPKLQPGDLVAGQYEVAGCLAHGGLGWIYLARDRNVSDRWVVLKGLLNSGDPDALAAAIAEQRFLAQVSHPHIVEIYNFVQWEDAGYIVMEYVGGTSLKALLKQRMRKAGHYDPLPVDQALAYVIELMPAFQYLHDLGLVYCDFKPDNVIQVGDDLKLIDMGGVRRIDDDDSAIFGTVGYQAPEVAEQGVSVASDLYTIGRTLVVLTMEFRGYQSTYVKRLPAVDQTPLFQKYDSFYRLVAKACAPSPDDRFSSADEMRVQMLGVLREVVATDHPDRVPGSTASLLFDEPTVSSDTLEWSSLPDLRRDPSDPMAGWLHGLAGASSGERVEAISAAPSRSPEVNLELARAALHLGRTELVEHAASLMLSDDPWEWRAVWVQGLAALRAGEPVDAQAAFNAVYGQVPGELAPKLALALACERGGEGEVAESLYAACARTDANYTPAAAFGMARVRATRGDLRGAVEALDLIPSTSRAFSVARQARATLLARRGPDLHALRGSLASVERVLMDPKDRAVLKVTVFERALEQVTSGGDNATVQVGGRPATAKSLRAGLEESLRELARLTPDGEQRIALVDRANQVRPWSWR